MSHLRKGCLGLLVGGLVGMATFVSADDKGSAADQSDNNYYWQGTQLYNLGRLGEAFESYEKAIQKKQNSKESEAYLLQIRQEIVTNAKKRSDERTALNYGGTNPDTALNIAYVEKGFIRITVLGKFLFDENSASFKTGAMDVINKLVNVLQTKDSQRVQVTLINEIDDVHNVRDIDAERALLVFSLINFKRTAASNPA